jgi:hypothetical protein
MAMESIVAVREWQRHWLLRQFGEDGQVLPENLQLSTHIDRLISSVEQRSVAMTTTVKVHVNGKYRATVRQDGGDPVIVEGNYSGGSGERSFHLPHPARATFEISEEPVADGDER